MSSMPFFQAALLAISIVVLVVATQWRHRHPFVVFVFVASGFGLIAGLSVSLLGKAFGTGFSEAIYSPGMVIVGAAFVAAFAENTGATDRLMAVADRWRSWIGSTRLTALLGLIAGVGASPSTAFALLTPLIPAVGGAAAEKRRTVPLALALAISASHGLVAFSPVVDRGRFHPRRRLDPRRLVRLAGGSFVGRFRRGLGTMAAHCRRGGGVTSERTGERS